MENNRKNMDAITSLMLNIDKSMEMTREKQQKIDSMQEELMQETRPMMVEQRKKEIAEKEQDKKEFDEMTENALKRAKTDIIGLREQSEKEYADKLLETLEKRKQIEQKLDMIEKKGVSDDKLEMARNSASKALEKVNDEMRIYQENHFALRAKLDEFENNIDNYALELGVEIEVEQPTQEQPEPTKPEPTKPEPAKSEPAKSEPTKSEPAKSEPTKSEPTKPEPAKSEPANNETAKKGKTISIDAFAEKIYGKMGPDLRNNIYKYMTGQTKELGEDAKKIFNRLQEQYGPDVESKIESHIKKMSAKEFLKVTGIKTDVTTGTITIDFNCGDKFKPVAADVKIYGRNGARLYSVKDAKKLAASKCEFDEVIADPYVVSAIAQATRTQLVKLGLNEEQISKIDIQKQVDRYQEALKTSKDERPEDKKLYMYIEYVKSDEEKPIKAGRKKFEKELRPFLREAQESAYVEIDDSIDIRTGMEKIKDALSTPWRWLTGKNKPLPAGGKYKGKYLKEDKTEEDKAEEKLTGEELTNVARNLGIDAQMKLVHNIPTGEIDEDLTPEQEEKLNDMLREHQEKISMKPQASTKYGEEPNAERNDDDELEI